MEHGNLVVGAVLEEFRVKLLVLGDVDGMDGVGQLQFFKGNRDLAAIGSGPGVEINHGFKDCGNRFVPSSRPVAPTLDWQRECRPETV